MDFLLLNGGELADAAKTHTAVTNLHIWFTPRWDCNRTIIAIAPVRRRYSVISNTRRGIRPRSALEVTFGSGATSYNERNPLSPRSPLWIRGRFARNSNEFSEAPASLTLNG